MDSLTDAQTLNLMEKIREKTKTVKDLCATVKFNTAVYQSNVMSGAPFDEEIDVMHSEMNEKVLQLTSPHTTPKDKEIISDRLSNLVQHLDRQKFAHQKRKSRFLQDLLKLQNAQVSFDTESCVLNELAVDMLGVASESLCHCIQQRRQLPQPRRRFFSMKDCAQAPNKYVGIYYHVHTQTSFVIQSYKTHM